MRHGLLLCMMVLCAVLVAVLASPAQPRSVRSLESLLWTIDLTTISSRVEAGSFGNFDNGFLRATSGGARLQADGKGVEDWTIDRGPRDGFFEVGTAQTAQTRSRLVCAERLEGQRRLQLELLQLTVVDVDRRGLDLESRRADSNRGPLHYE